MAFVVYDQATSMGSSPTTSVVVSLPTDGTIQPGDVICISAASDGELREDFATSGDVNGAATNLVQLSTTSVSLWGGNLEYLIQPSGGSVDTELTISQSPAIGRQTAIYVFVLRGIDLDTPVAVSPVLTTTTAIEDPNPPALTTTEDGQLRMVGAFMDDVNATTVGAPSTFSEVGFAALAVFDGATTMMALREEPTAGLLDPTAFTPDVNDQYTAYHMAWNVVPPVTPIDRDADVAASSSVSAERYIGIDRAGAISAASLLAAEREFGFDRAVAVTALGEAIAERDIGIDRSASVSAVSILSAERRFGIDRSASITAVSALVADHEPPIDLPPLFRTILLEPAGRTILL